MPATASSARPRAPVDAAAMGCAFRHSTTASRCQPMPESRASAGSRRHPARSGLAPRRFADIAHESLPSLKPADSASVRYAPPTPRLSARPTAISRRMADAMWSTMMLLLAEADCATIARSARVDCRVSRRRYFIRQPRHSRVAGYFHAARRRPHSPMPSRFVADFCLFSSSPLARRAPSGELVAFISLLSAAAPLDLPLSRRFCAPRQGDAGSFGYDLPDCLKCLLPQASFVMSHDGHRFVTISAAAECRASDGAAPGHRASLRRAADCFDAKPR